MIATNLREVYYQLAITCDLCKSFASMSVQSILEHHSGYKAKCTKEAAEQEGYDAKKLHMKKLEVWEQEKLPKASLIGTDESCRAKRFLTPSIQFC